MTTTEKGATEPLNPVADAFTKLRASGIEELAKALVDGDAGKTAEPEGTPKEAGAETVLSQEKALSTESTTATAETTEEAQATETAETTETTEAETAEAETEEEAEAALGVTPDIQSRIDKRIGKAIAKQKAAEEERAQLQARLEEAERLLAEREQAPPPPQPQPEPFNPNQPLAHIRTEAQLRTEESNAQNALEAAENMLLALGEDPQSVEAALHQANIKLVDAAGEPDFSEQRIKSFLERKRVLAERTLKAVPKRQAFLANLTRAQAEAETLLPELKDRKSQRYAIYQRVMNGFAPLQQLDRGPLEAAVHVLGLERLAELANAKAKPPAKAAAAARKPVPPKLPASVAALPTEKPRADVPDEDLVKRAFGGDKNARLELISKIMPGFK